MTQNPFEMPKAIREMTEKNVEQAQVAVRQFSDAMSQALGMWTKALPVNQATVGFQAVQDRAVDFAKHNADAALRLAGELAKAKSAQDILSLQGQFAQAQMQACAMQTQELGRLMMEAMQGMAKK